MGWGSSIVYSKDPNNPSESWSLFPIGSSFMATMLRPLSPSRLQGRLQSLPGALPASLCLRTEKRFPLLRVLGSLGRPNSPLFCRRALCSEAGGESGDSEQPVEAPSAIVPTNPRPEDHLSVSNVSFTQKVHGFVFVCAKLLLLLIFSGGLTM